MLGLSRQVQQALAVVLCILAFGLGMMYSRWQGGRAGEDIFLLEEGAIGAVTEAQEEPARELKVHVAGAVLQPGVYAFPEKSRVEDAVALAQPLPEADLDAINLAAYLRDEQRIYVPYRQAGNGAAAGGGGAAGGHSAGEQGKVNINTAGPEELMTLPGIGPALAQRIIDYRNSHGPFKSLEELKNVSGIGEKRYQDLAPRITY